MQGTPVGEGGFRCELQEYLSRRYGRDVRVLALARLGGDAGEKEFGYGVPVRVTLEGAPWDEVVVHTASTDAFGHETLADRAASAILAYETFNNLPFHVGALDVGAFRSTGSWESLSDARDFFVITEYARGEPYFHDLERIAHTNRLNDYDLRRVDHLAAYLAEIHALPNDEPSLYVRRVRELFGHHECILGLIDSYDAFPISEFTSAGQLRQIEHRCLDWRHRLKGFGHRLRRVHGDFHPWNVLWRPDDEFTLLDRSRGEWGEPADDVSCMAINYLFFSLQAQGRPVTALRELWSRFFDRYLAVTEDRELLQVIPPYFVWRALVIASPLWYPWLELEVRRSLFQFIERVLDVEQFDPGGVDALLGEAVAR
jgi:hypothetical protein